MESDVIVWMKVLKLSWILGYPADAVWEDYPSISYPVQIGIGPGSQNCLLFLSSWRLKHSFIYIYFSQKTFEASCKSIIFSPD